MKSKILIWKDAQNANLQRKVWSTAYNARKELLCCRSNLMEQVDVSIAKVAFHPKWISQENKLAANAKAIRRRRSILTTISVQDNTD